MYFPLSSVRAMGLTLFIYYYQANILLPYLKENACSIYKKKRLQEWLGREVTTSGSNTWASFCFLKHYTIHVAYWKIFMFFFNFCHYRNN